MSEPTPQVQLIMDSLEDYISAPLRRALAELILAKLEQTNAK